AVLGLNTVLQKAYGTDQGGTGSNFSYVICGLTVGTIWDGCPIELAKQGEFLKYDEPTIARKLYAFAWQNFQAKPHVFFARLGENLTIFASSLPDTIWHGYDVTKDEAAWFSHRIVVALFLVGLFLSATKITDTETAFWKLFFPSVIASAALIYSDDGQRTL